MTLQGLKSAAERMWRHKDKYAAQLADRLTLRKVIQTDDEALELVVAIRYVGLTCKHLPCAATPSHPAAPFYARKSLWHDPPARLPVLCCLPWIYPRPNDHQ